MKLLAWLTEVFINTFGITRPRPEQERRAQLLIGGFVLAFMVGGIAMIGLLLFAAHHSR
jgi:hypothetical protein